MSDAKPKAIQIPDGRSHDIDIRQGSSPNNVIMIFVIQGKENKIKVDLNNEIKIAVFEVFKLNKLGHNLDNWMIKTRDGIQLSFNKSYKSQNITKPEALFLTKGPGRGG